MSVIDVRRAIRAFNKLRLRCDYEEWPFWDAAERAIDNGGCRQ